MLTYTEASPWATAIKDAVLQRTMPPWGAVKGFGSFRNEQALGQEELDLIEKWVTGGVPEGNPDHLPLRVELPQPTSPQWSGDPVVADSGFVAHQPMTLDGFRVLVPPKSGNAQITITFPNGRVEPLVWLYGFTTGIDHPFLLRAPLILPVGSTLQGLSDGVRLALYPAKATR